MHTYATCTCTGVTPALLTSPGPPQSVLRHPGDAASLLPCAGAPCQQPSRATAGAAPGVGCPPVPVWLPPAPRLQARPDSGVNLYQQVDGLCGRCRSCNLLHADAVDSPPSVGLSWPASRLSAVQHGACIRSAACFHLDPVDTGQWRYHARQVGPTAHSCTFLSTRQQAHHFERTAAHCSNAYCPWTALQCQSR